MNSKCMLILYLYFLCLTAQKSSQQELNCLFKNCTCTQVPSRNLKEIVVNIYCDGKSATNFPERTTTNAYPFRIHTLQLINFNWDSISNDMFSHLTIESLDLRQNSINSLSVNTFNGISNLQVLDLSENELTQIFGNEMFRHLENLTALSLASNKMTQLPSDLLTNIKSLKTLDLSNNLLASLDKSIYEPAKNTLGSLYIAGNKLEVLPSMKSLNILNYLDFSDNLVKSFDNVELPVSLTGLVGSNNRVEKINAASLKNLKNLLILDLTNNLISSIDKSAFYTNTQLNVLRLGGNKILTLPNVLPLVNLAEFDLSNQKLTSFKRVAYFLILPKKQIF